MKQLLLPLCFIAVTAAAAPLQTGQTLPALTLKDQHEKTVTVTRDTRIIFVAAEMAASRMMAKALEELPPTALKDSKAIYIADISSMPAPISSIVALPKMQKLPYSIAVVRYAKDGPNLPTKAGAVTAARVEDGRISALEFPQSAQQIAAYLKEQGAGRVGAQ